MSRLVTGAGGEMSTLTSHFESFAFYFNHTPVSNLTGSSECGNTSRAYDTEDGGIPASLYLNLVVWVAAIILFCCINSWLRRKGKQQLLSASHHSITQSGSEESREFTDGQEEQDIDERWYAWIPALFRLRDEDIHRRCGEDATHYLSMERHLLCVMCIFTVLSIGIILPVNYTASSLGKSGFARTTVDNLPEKSSLYWLHAIVALVYLLIIFVAMWRFSRRLSRFRVSGHMSKHTLLVSRISEGSTVDEVRQHFQEAYEDSDIMDVQMGYDVSKLTKLDKKRINAIEERERYEAILNESGERPTTAPGCKKLYCCTDVYDIDAIDHYSNKTKRLCEKCQAEHETVIKEKNLQYAFVSFSTSAVAHRCYDDYLILRRNIRPRTSVGDQIGSSGWIVTKASVPDNIIWENLQIRWLEWLVRYVFINGGLFLFFFFFTTPSIIMSSLPKLKKTLHLSLPESAANNVVFTVYLPTLTLLLLASLLPLIVSFSCYLESHWYRSTLERYIIRKTYVYLVLIIIVLPALGLTSLDAIANAQRQGSFKQNLACIFLPSGGGFFVNYVIFSAFIGTAFSLCRIPSLICFMWRMCMAKTRSDRAKAHKATVVPFQIGIEYAWVLTIFSLCVTFSTVCPLIVPFGVVYFCLKYWVDKYNLYYATLPPKFQGTTGIHNSAVNFAFSSAVFLQFIILFYSVLRSRSANDPSEVFSIMIIVIILSVCLANAFFGVFLKCLPSQVQSRDDMYQAVEDLQEENYKAPVLKREFDCGESLSNTSSQQQSTAKGYQTFGSTSSHSSSGDNGNEPVDVQ